MARSDNYLAVIESSGFVISELASITALPKALAYVCVHFLRIADARICRPPAIAVRVVPAPVRSSISWSPVSPVS